MTDSGRILQASKVIGCFEEIMDGNLMLSNGSEEGPEAVSTHFDVTIDFVDEWLGRNVEALIINNVCVRLTDKENGLAYPEVTTVPAMGDAEEADETPTVDSHEHDDDPEHTEVSAEAAVMEVAGADEEEEADNETPAIAAFELSRQASLLETPESEEPEEEDAPASEESAEAPSIAAQAESAEERRIVWPPFEDEEEEEAPAETSSHSYALSQSSSEPKTDDHRNRETDYFRF